MPSDDGPGSDEAPGAAIAQPVDGRNLAVRFGAELLVLQRLGVDQADLEEMARLALSRGTTIEQELLAGGRLDETAYYRAMADLLALPLLTTIPPEKVFDAVHLDSQLANPVMLRLHDKQRPPLTVLAPEARRLPALQHRLDRLPDLHASLAIAAPRTIREAVWKVGAERRAQRVTTRLFDDSPQHSARMVLSGGQGFWAGSLLAVLLCGLAAAPALVGLLLHIALSSLYLSMLGLRGLTLFCRRRLPPPPATMTATDLPVYTVLVALYREAAVLPQLLEALSRLDWPTSRLDIKLVCEEDDHPTLAALAFLTLPAHIEVVLVPALGPRTKPKALVYALSGARGQFLVIYDAEDQPHPGQLREAYGRFLASGPEVAVLQAPLVIGNIDDSFISSLFALEYAALFRGMLPMLARLRMPLPLGGTSNHFRLAALEQVGAWDPHNVTEDADLGIRLYRAGYRCDTLLLPTLEDAPVTGSVWFGQRSRWYKGWLQTWLVVMRHPLQAYRELGGHAFLVFQLLIGGMLVSALGHPALLLFIGSTVHALALGTRDLQTGLIFWIDIVNIVGSYLVFYGLGRRAMTKVERVKLGSWPLLIPLYWMMTSLAAWRAVIELRIRPFFWNKTPHRPTARHRRKMASQPGAAAGE